MSRPIQIQIRGEDSVRQKWMEAKGQFDMTHAELAVALCRFALQRKGDFRRSMQGEDRPGHNQ
jgi:hypothetical protein